jgi:hypothetical protein
LDIRNRIKGPGQDYSQDYLGTGISELEVEIQSQRGELNTGNIKPHYRRVTPLDEQEKS